MWCDDPYSLIAAAVSAQIAAFLVAASYALGAPVEWGFTARTAITWGALADHGRRARLPMEA